MAGSWLAPMHEALEQARKDVCEEEQQSFLQYREEEERARGGGTSIKQGPSGFWLPPLTRSLITESEASHEHVTAY